MSLQSCKRTKTRTPKVQKIQAVRTTTAPWLTTSADRKVHMELSQGDNKLLLQVVNFIGLTGTLVFTSFVMSKLGQKTIRLFMEPPDYMYRKSAEMINRDALSWLAQKFIELRDWVGKVVGGISDALAAGDIALAAEILWLSLKVIWQQGVAALNKAWLGAKEFFVSTAYSMWYGALAAAEIVFHALEVAWIETTAFLSKTWTNFATGFQMIWEEASSWVAKRMLEIQGLFDDGLDVDVAKKAVDQQLESRLVELENAAQQSVTARDKEREAQRRDAAAMHEATLAGIGQDFENAQEALRKDTAAGLAESQAALDAAKQKLAAAIEEARKKREAADAEKGPGRPQRDLMADFEDRLSGLGAAIGKGISVTGTFSAAAVSGLGTGGDAAERTASATEQTARNTKRLLDASVDNGLRFA